MTPFDHPSRRQLLLAAGALAAIPAARAQPAGWPTKPIRIVLQFPPGGSTDAVARILAQPLSAALGQQVLVENRPGADGAIAGDFVARSDPDGHTLVITTSGTVWQNRVLYTKLPYNLDKDLAPVTIFPSGPLVVGVPEKLGINTMKEFIAWAKAFRDAGMTPE